MQDTIYCRQYKANSPAPVLPVLYSYDIYVLR